MGIRSVIICITVYLCITKNKKVILQHRFVAMVLFYSLNFKIWVCNENMCLFVPMVLSVIIIIKYKGIIGIEIYVFLILWFFFIAINFEIWVYREMGIVFLIVTLKLS